MMESDPKQSDPKQSEPKQSEPLASDVNAAVREKEAGTDPPGEPTPVSAPEDDGPDDTP